MAWPRTYYKVLMPTYSETGDTALKTDRLSGRSYELRWQAVAWVVVGYAESMEDAKAKYPWMRHPVLEPVGFRPRELCMPPEEERNYAVA